MSKASKRDTSNLTPEQVMLCSQFSEFTGATQEVAAMCMRRNHWNIEAAMGAFFDNPAAFAPPPPDVDAGAILTMFKKYKDEEEENCIGIDGILQFCTDIDITPDDVRMLVFTFNLQVKSPVKWTQMEWVSGMTRMGCDSVAKVKSKMISLQADLVDPNRFKQFYAFSFDMSRAEGQKVLDLDTAVQLWRMVLKDRFHHLDAWCEFLEKVYKKSITKDTWMLTYDFSVQSNADMTNIDLDSSAWPVVIDEFVEYYRAKR
uniref:Defective in cullin neddylation protein n=1 Tax=Hemiselmis tepida TaxID=464990 RepID=A0A7S0VA35_9CRYP